jgi:hypothetical protein
MSRRLERMSSKNIAKLQARERARRVMRIIHKTSKWPFQRRRIHQAHKAIRRGRSLEGKSLPRDVGTESTQKSRRKSRSIPPVQNAQGPQRATEGIPYRGNPIVLCAYLFRSRLLNGSYGTRRTESLLKQPLITSYPILLPPLLPDRLLPMRLILV